MRRLALILALLPGTAFAQQAQINPAFVQQCLAQTKPGQIAPACVGYAAKACEAQPGGQTTLGMSQCLQAEAGAWDKLLNIHYGKLRTQYRQQGGDLAGQLLKAQRAWIAFRDAQCALEYSSWGNGSMRTIAAADCLMRMTATRTIELRDMEGN